jgi:hypothetical protein
MLELEQDEQLQRRMWRLQRIGWALTALILAAALAGLAGNGPLADAEAQADGLRIRYSRLERIGRDFALEVELHGTAERGFWLSQSYVRRLRLISVTPEPESVTADADRLTFQFHPKGSTTRAVLTFRSNDNAPGFRRARAGRPGGPELPFQQFLYP